LKYTETTNMASAYTVKESMLTIKMWKRSLLITTACIKSKQTAF